MTDNMAISRDDEIIGGKARIEGSRVSVEQVYGMHKARGMEPQEIAEALPTVSLKEVKEAIEHMEKKQKKTSTVSTGAKA